MIKILSTTDWHIGNNFHGFDRHEEHAHFLSWLLDVIDEKRPDALLVSGDVFDNSNPSATSQELFYSFIDRLTERFPELQTVIIAGNHDSAARLEAPRAMLERHNVHVRGVVKRDVDGGVIYDDLIVEIHSHDGSDTAYVLAVPYLRDGDFPRGMAYSEGVNCFISEITERVFDRYCKVAPQTVASDDDTAKNNSNVILMAHLYATGSEIAENSSERIVVGGSEQVDMAMLDPRISLVLLGHLHRRQKLAGRDDRIYPGSALPMSFTEKSYKHGAVYAEIENGSIVSAPEYIDYILQHPLITVPEKPLPLDEVIRFLSELPDSSCSSECSCSSDSSCSSESSYSSDSFCSSESSVSAEPTEIKGFQCNNEPYLEVQIYLESPVIGINKKIEDALKGKAVRLCRTVIVYPSVTSGNGETGTESIEDLLNRNPIEVIKKSYFNKYGHEMRDELVALANVAIEEARKSVDGNL